MIIGLSILVILFSVPATFAPAFVAFFPQVFSPGVLYRLRLKRWIVLGFTLILSIILSRVTGSYAIVIIWGVLALISIRLNPTKAIYALDYPPNVSADEAMLPDDVLVVGFAHNGEARAWPNAMVIPHHLINDRLGGKPILVAH